jgi:enoyl-CoA hydratase
MPETLTVERAETIVTIGLNQLTMPPLMFRELGSLFRELADDSAVRAVIIQSNAKHFTYGLDLKAAMAEGGLTSSGGGGANARLAFHRRILKMQEDVSVVAACPVPVIAAVHGRCIGGGIDLISACDIRLATSDAQFSVRETKVAIVADLGTLQRLPLIIGQGHVRELAFTGKDISATRAQQIGLVNDVYADQAELQRAARALASEIAQNSPLTVRGVKRVLDFGQGKPATDGLAYVAAWNSAFLASEDLVEAMQAFAEKRPPRFGEP